MASAYATFAARGIHCDALPVTQILGADGAVVKDYGTSCEQVMPGVTADAVNDVLRGVMEPGGFGAELAIDKPSAGKTGTNQGNMSVWFVGYTPEIATASMVAGANSLGHWVSLNGQYVGGSYIGEAFGSTVAGPIWGEAMSAVSSWLDYEDFQAPAGDEIAGVLTDVPDVSGMTVKDAKAKLAEYGFESTLEGYSNSEVPVDNVVFTTPSAGTSLGSGDTVGIYQSTGYVPAPPPENNGNKGKGNKGNGKGRGNR